MISQAQTGAMFPKEILETDCMTSNSGWIFDFTLTNRDCKPITGWKVTQYELSIVEKVNDQKFGPIIFQLAGKTYGDVESVAQGLFYRLTTMLSYDLDDYSIDEAIHIRGIRDFIENELKEIYKDDAYPIGFFSNPIVYKEVPPKFLNLKL